MIINMQKAAKIKSTRFDDLKAKRMSSFLFLSPVLSLVSLESDANLVPLIQMQSAKVCVICRNLAKIFTKIL